MVYKRKIVLKTALPETISNVLLGDDADKNTPSSGLVFYDTETTGLSAGAGNIVFLAGFGVRDSENETLSITQFFLSDFPGEAAFLQCINEFIRPEKIFVSYNGKAFDANILRSRFALNRLQADFGYQLDLLYSSRRLWRNVIGGCSLGDIEREVLDKRRTMDVPGFMVPDLYFDFIRGGRWESIEPVIEHHLEDISSLAELLAVQENIFSSKSPDIIVDPIGLAGLLAGKKPYSAALMLQQCFKDGNHKAGIELSLQFKRKSQWKDAAEVWIRMWEERKSVFAGIELAKYFEHQARDLDAALEITSSMLDLERFRIVSVLSELDKRKKRLEKKKLKQV